MSLAETSQEGGILIRAVAVADAAHICEIYNRYVTETVVTFEERLVSPGEMGQRITSVITALPWLIAERQGAIVGYAYATSWKDRSAYRFSVETTVYLAPEFGRQGIGLALYRGLIAQLRERGLHCIIGGIALPNPASVGLHEKLGFKKVAHFEKVGWKFGRWVDVGYWQLLL